VRRTVADVLVELGEERQRLADRELAHRHRRPGQEVAERILAETFWGLPSSRISTSSAFRSLMGLFRASTTKASTST